MAKLHDELKGRDGRNIGGSGSASTPVQKKSIFSYKATWLVIGLIAGFVLGIIL